VSDIEFVIKKSKNLESRLKREFGAKGTGLLELAKNVQSRLPSGTYENIRQLNEMRNQLVHEVERNQLNNKPEFKRLYKEIERSLNKLKRARRAPEWYARTAAFIIFILAALVIYFLAQYPL
jgi:hypothetical protein